MNWAATPAGRGVRAGSVAAIAVALAVGAHWAACGVAPSVPVVLLGVVLAGRICWGASAARLSWPRLTGLVLAVQTGLHIAFAVTTTTGSPHPASTTGTSATHLAAMTHEAARVDLLPGGPAMIAAHLLAAIGLAWWLAVGERLLWRAARGAVTVARRAAGRLRRRGLCVPPAAVGPLPRRPVHTRTCRPVLLHHIVVRRGPPVRAAV
ncbi:hypothetical protein MXD59_05025 [Frankia sp. Ag45/Mut15]|uniref:Integral membrane protein n=1 Tax=Frankia umida TaxID=573489 RepID=A0ABT0JUC4_9ACTN|nr:hypothetical protein [Frankia umida]MCK9875150.1 hypothetical protein [Frankia umida]